jgi:hypothetical protein
MPRSRSGADSLRGRTRSAVCRARAPRSTGAPCKRTLRERPRQPTRPRACGARESALRGDLLDQHGESGLPPRLGLRPDIQLCPRHLHAQSASPARLGIRVALFEHWHVSACGRSAGVRKRKRTRACVRGGWSDRSPVWRTRARTAPSCRPAGPSHSRGTRTRAEPQTRRQAWTGNRPRRDGVNARSRPLMRRASRALFVRALAWTWAAGAVRRGASDRAPCAVAGVWFVGRSLGRRRRTAKGRAMR